MEPAGLVAANLWMTFFFGFGGLGLPVGIPPAPEDPMMAKVAPPECLFYTTWAGMAKPDPQSTNPTEQLLAEPEVRRLVAAIEEIIKAAIAQANRGQEPQAAAAENGLRLGKTLLTHSAALFVSGVKVAPGGPPEVRAGAVAALGEEAEQFNSSLDELLKMLPPEAQIKTVHIEGAPWSQLQPPNGPPITWGLKDKHLIVAIGEGELESILKRASGEPPKWLADARKALPVPRVATFSYVNVKKILETFLPLAGEPQAQQVVEALGLGNVASLVSATGLDESGHVSRTLLALDGQAFGILTLVSDRPLEAADLAPIPRDATLAVAARIDADGIYQTIRSVVAKIEPQAKEQMDAGLAEAQAQLGIDLGDDLLKPLGDVWCAYSSPGEGGLVITGLTVVVRLKDAQRLAKTNERLATMVDAAIKDELARDGRGSGGISRFGFAGKTIWCFNAPNRDFPLTPAWCVTDKELIVALFPQNIKAYLGRGADFQSLAKAPEVARVLEGGAAASLLAYADTPSLFKMLYPMLQIGLQVAAQQLEAEEGFRLDASLLPSAAAIGRHLRADVAGLRRTGSGLEATSHKTLPCGSVGASAPVMVALLLPAVQAARQAARRTQSSNNMKMIALAMHSYADSRRGAFPPGFSTDKDGKPLLSWRVLILPYLEQQALYEQFHLDEPWDSEHNKKLIEQMPQVYRSPNSTAPPNKTVYLTVRGEKTAFPGAKGIRFAQILDGTSNTIMTVEANDPSAVIWTKPDDFVPDPETPLKGLVGLNPGGFLVGFCDGSVRFISADIDPDTLRALFTRDGGEVVDHDRLDARPRRRAPGPPRAIAPPKPEARNIDAAKEPAEIIEERPVRKPVAKEPKIEEPKPEEKPQAFSPKQQ